MSGKRYSQEQVLKVLREIDDGARIASVRRAHGVGVQTIYGWRKRFAGMSGSKLAELKALQDENRKLNRIVANMALDIEACKELLDSESGEPRLTPMGGGAHSGAGLLSRVRLPGVPPFARGEQARAQGATTGGAVGGAAPGEGEPALRLQARPRAAAGREPQCGPPGVEGRGSLAAPQAPPKARRPEDARPGGG